MIIGIVLEIWTEKGIDSVKYKKDRLCSLTKKEYDFSIVNLILIV